MPPEKMCSLSFLKDVMVGKKSLMKIDKVMRIPKIPRIPEIKAEEIWEELKKETEITKYFPQVYVESDRVPNRDYMFSVFSKDIRGSRS